MSSLRYACMSVLLLCAAVSAVQGAEVAAPAPVDAAAARKVLEALPADAFAVVAVKSISGLDESVRAFITAVEPQMGDESPVESMLENAPWFGSGAAINRDAPLVAAFIARSGEDEPVWLVMLPVTDYEAWLADQEQDAQKDEAGREYLGDPVEEQYGERMYFKRVGDYVALAQTGDTLDKMGASAGMEAQQVDKLAKQLDGAPLAASFSMTRLLAAYPEIKDKFLAGVRSMPMGAAAGEGGSNVQVDAMAKTVESLMDGTGEISVAVTPTADALKLTFGVEAVKGSSMAGFFRATPAADLGGLAALPAGALMSGSMRWPGKDSWDSMLNIYMDLLKSAAETPEQAAAAEAAARDAIAKFDEYGLSNVYGALYKGTGAFNVAGIYAVKDSAKTLDVVEKLALNKDLNLLMWKAQAASGLKVTDIQVTHETVDGTPVTVVTQKYDYSGMPADAAGRVRMMLGDSMVMRYAAMPGKLLLSMSKDADLLRKMLKVGAAESGMDAERLKAAAAGVGPQPSALLLIDVPSYLNWAMGMVMPGMMPQAAPVDGGVPASVGVTMGDARVDATVYVPIRQIQATKESFEQGRSAGVSGALEKSPGDAAGNLKAIGLALGMYQVDYNEAMPGDLQTLLKERYITEPERFLSSDSMTGIVDPDDVDKAGDYYYARVKEPGKAADPATVPVAWEKKVWRPGEVAVLWLDLHVSSSSPEVLAAAVEKNKALYEKAPQLPTQDPGFTLE